MALTLTFGSLLETHVGDYCVGDGITDDAAGLAAAVTNAGTTQVLVFQPGKTYLIGALVTLPSKLLVFGNGATLKKTTSLNDYILKVTGPDCEIEDLNLDGNRAGGNANVQGILWFNGLRGVARRVKATNGKLVGIFCTGAGNVVDCYDCEGSDIVTSPSTGDGFQFGAGGLIRTWGNCKANNNGHCGFHCSASGADGAHIEGTAENNLFAGASLLSDNGTGAIKTGNNQYYGVYGASATGWVLSHVEDTDCGQGLNGEYTPSGSGEAFELYGCDNWRVDSLDVRRPTGYGAALTSIGGVGCTYCSFGSVYVDTPADPAFHISGNSQDNTIESLIVRGDIAVSFGEGVTGNNNDRNRFNFIHAIDCGYSVIRGTTANNNTFGRVIATNCWNRTPYVGFVQWTGPDADGNKIHFWHSENPGTPPGGGAALPDYVMNCDATASDNKIIAGIAANYTIAVLNDLNSTNRVSLARQERNTVTYSASMTFDASIAEYQRITVTNGTAMTINAPTNPGVGQRLTVDVLNSSGGAMGAITWNAVFKLAGAFTNPASTKRRTISFIYDGTNWVETNRAAADI